MNEELKVNKDVVLEIYKVAQKANDFNTLYAIEAMFGKDIFKPKDITERVKTFEDACRELGKDHPLVCQYYAINDVDTNLNAYLKLRIIVAALNEGWEPTFSKDEWRYIPWFYIYSEEELKKINNEINGERSPVIYRGILSTYAISCVPYAGVDVGSRLALKSEKLAKYCGEQFIDIWFDFIC